MKNGKSRFYQNSITRKMSDVNLTVFRSVAKVCLNCKLVIFTLLRKKIHEGAS